MAPIKNFIILIPLWQFFQEKYSCYLYGGIKKVLDLENCSVEKS